MTKNKHSRVKLNDKSPFDMLWLPLWIPCSRKTVIMQDSGKRDIVKTRVAEKVILLISLARHD